MESRAIKTVRSWDEIREHIEQVVERVNADSGLAIASALNPLLALEELGFHIAPEARPEIEDRLRFRPREVVVRKQLRSQIFELAGREFDPGSAEETRRILFDELGLRPYPDERGYERKLPSTQPLPRQRLEEQAARDPLEELSGKHPIIEPLLEYRRMDSMRPRLAPAEHYEAVRNGERAIDVTGIRYRFRREAATRSPQ